MYPDSKRHGANIGPTWVLSAPDGPHVGPMNLVIRVWRLLRENVFAWTQSSVLMVMNHGAEAHNMYTVEFRYFWTNIKKKTNLNLKSKSKRVYLQSALGYINASGRSKAVIRRSQAVFKCLQWWGIDSFLAEGIPVKHSTSKKWIFGSVMARPGSSSFLSWSCRMGLSGRGAKRLPGMATRPCLIL